MPDITEPVLCDYTLMSKNDAVFDFTYDLAHEQVYAIGKVIQPQLAPIGACVAPHTPTVKAFAHWLSCRVASKDRFDWDYMSEVGGFNSPLALLFKNYGQGLTDQYWFAPKGEDIDWHTVNFFENDFEHDIDGTGPGGATSGLSFKWWECHDGLRKLYKLADDNNERAAYAQRAASALLARLLDPQDYLAYELADTEYGTCSTCDAMVDANTQFVSFRDLARCYRGNAFDGTYEQCRDLLLELGIPDVKAHLSKMIVCDFLGGNAARSFDKFGVLRSSEDGTFMAFAPLFSHGNFFFADAEKENDFVADIYPYRCQPFSPYSGVQLAMAEDLDWFDPDALDGFEVELEDILKENTGEAEWFHKAVADQYILQFSHVMCTKF